MEKEAERCTASFMAATSCVSIDFPFITTSCQLGGPLLPLRSEPQGFGVPAGRTPDDKQAPGLKGLQTMTDGARGPGPGPHQVRMTAPDHATGALLLRRSPLPDLFVPLGEALGCHRGPL